MHALRRLLALPLALCLSALGAAETIDVDAVYAAAARKAAAHDAAHPKRNAFPSDARGPAWRTVGIKDWVSGFYPGVLWQIAARARTHQWPDAAAWRARAEGWTAPLDPLGEDTTTHDLGFMVFDSAGRAFAETGDARWKDLVLRAANSLSKRYVPEARIIRSWGKISDKKRCQVIIDNMMNLELLWWAAENGGPKEAYQTLVKTHADHALDLFFRPDGSTYHLIELDPTNGALQAKKTAQGKAAESCWSRGLTWAIYGFAYLAEVTGEARYRDKAVAASEYYLAHLPADGVPPADFASTLTGLEFKDSSCVPIAACGFYRLARLVPDQALAQRLRQAADDGLRAVTRAPYYDDTPAQASLLVRGARNYCEDPKNWLTDVSLIWGDYYLLEALTAYEAARRAPEPR